MTAIPLGVLDSGSANLASVLAALRRLGASPIMVRDADGVRQSDRLVLPGVGAFGAVMSRLRALEVVEALAERTEQGRPLLAICLGLQVLGTASAESPGVAGLGNLNVVSRRFPATVRVPQLGWNRVTPVGENALVRPGHAFFANSYYVAAVDAPWNASYADHGVPFVAAVERGSQLACQFHPELSGRWGAELLARWWARC